MAKGIFVKIEELAMCENVGELLDEARAIVSDSVEKCLDKNITDWSKIKNSIKDDLSEYLWKKIKRNPVILPIIMEAQV